VGIQITECTLEQLEPILREGIARSLSKGEQPLTCLVSKQLQVVYIYVITDARLMCAGATRDPITKRVSPTRITSLSLDEIVGISTGDKWVRADRSDGMHIGCELDTKQRAQSFASSLQSAKDCLRASLSQPISPADRLRELAKLHSEGLISESEFQQKRREIMKQL